MNLRHHADLDALKSDIDELFGIQATWLSKVGQTGTLTGTFSFIEKEIHTHSKAKQAGQIYLDTVIATFCVRPTQCVCEEGDTLQIDGVDYLVLPFHKGEFETVLPLKVTQQKDHNWR